ncbi:MAG: hydrogenase maturation peptidase HycI, partial [Thermoplasmata archaeon]
FKVIDCGVIPENYTADVKRLKPRTLVIVDAVEMNLEPGEIRVVPRERIGVMHISTHGIPVSLLINYLKQYVEDIVFIGIQPKSMSGKMTDSVKKNADFLVELLKNRNLDKIKILN